MTEPAHRRAGRRGFPVTVRSMSDPRPGMSLQDAVGLAEQGYQLDHIERVTGFVSAHVAAQLGAHR